MVVYEVLDNVPLTAGDTTPVTAVDEVRLVPPPATKLPVTSV